MELQQHPHVLRMQELANMKEKEALVATANQVSQVVMLPMNDGPVSVTLWLQVA
jgi:hypothetical protein